MVVKLANITETIWTTEHEGKKDYKPGNMTLISRKSNNVINVIDF